MVLLVDRVYYAEIEFVCLLIELETLADKIVHNVPPFEPVEIDHIESLMNALDKLVNFLEVLRNLPWISVGWIFPTVECA
jgi:hypothetical protein